MTELTRDELIAQIAAVSHRTWMRQKERDHHVSRDSLDPEVTKHDLERAEDIVQELEKLSLWP